MKLLALTTCNDDYRYYRWIPHAVVFWRRLGFDFVVHFYADSVPDQLDQWREHIILQRPPVGLKVPSVCQVSRLFLPILHEEYDLILITDVDLLPLSRSYFDMVRNFPTDKFVAMRQKENEFFMGFNCASQAMWQKLTNIQPDQEGISQALLKLFAQHRSKRLRDRFLSRQIGVSWGLDQRLLKQYIGTLSERDKICISGLEEVYSLHSGFTIKPAYFKEKGTQVDENWISGNKEKIAFYTRDDLRSLDAFDEEISFLAELYE